METGWENEGKAAADAAPGKGAALGGRKGAVAAAGLGGGGPAGLAAQTGDQEGAGAGEEREGRRLGDGGDRKEAAGVDGGGEAVDGDLGELRAGDAARTRERVGVHRARPGCRAYSTRSTKHLR